MDQDPRIRRRRTETKTHGRLWGDPAPLLPALWISGLTRSDRAGPTPDFTGRFEFSSDAFRGPGLIIPLVVCEGRSVAALWRAVGAPSPMEDEGLPSPVLRDWVEQAMETLMLERGVLSKTVSLGTDSPPEH